MSTQFLRKYKLYITSLEGSQRNIEDLRVRFEVTKTVLSFPNLAKIEIYNPNSDTTSLLKEKFTNISLEAGYQGNSRLIFKGEVRNVYQNKIGPDRIVIIYAGDGQRDWENSFFNKTFKENIRIDTVINEILKTFQNTTIGVIDGIPKIADKLRGQTLSGSSKDILDMLSKEYNFDWNIQDGELNIVSKNKLIENDEAILINNLTGMIGSPTVTEIGADVKTLLNPRLIPNRSFKIESAFANIALGNIYFRDIKRTNAEGLYKIQEVVFIGDSRDGEWVSNVKGISL